MDASRYPKISRSYTPALELERYACSSGSPGSCMRLNALVSTQKLFETIHTIGGNVCFDFFGCYGVAPQLIQIGPEVLHCHVTWECHDTIVVTLIPRAPQPGDQQFFE